METGDAEKESLDGWLVGWLNLSNAQLSPKRYWQGPRSQEMGEEGELHLTLHCQHQNDSCIKSSSDKSHFNVSLVVRDKKSQDSVHRPQPMKREER